MRADPVSSATCRQIMLDRCWSLQAGRTSARHCPVLGQGDLCSPELWGPGPIRRPRELSNGASLMPAHILLPPFIIASFSQPLLNPDPHKNILLLHPEHPMYTLTPSHPTALGTAYHGWAGGCSQTPTQVQCLIVTRPRDRDILGVLSFYSSGGPWVLGSPRGLGCAVGLARQSSAGVMRLLWTLHACTRG